MRDMIPVQTAVDVTNDIEKLKQLYRDSLGDPIGYTASGLIHADGSFRKVLEKGKNGSVRRLVHIATGEKLTETFVTVDDFWDFLKEGSRVAG